MTKTFSFSTVVVAAGLVAAAFLGFYFIALADASTITFEPTDYHLGNINGQDGWSKTGPYDAVVSSSFGVTGFSSQSLRISNAVTSGGFGDQTFAKPLTDAAGEAGSTDGAFSRGTLQNHFEASFDIRPMQLSQQSGLAISVSPDRGDGSRMSYLRFADQSDGVHVYFDDVTGVGSPANFVETDIATLSRGINHNIKFVMDFKDGPSNDVVKIYIDSALIKTGTSWENYYRYDSESSAEQSPRIVKTLLFRAAGTAALATNGLGYLFDNVSLASSISAPPPPATLIVDDNGAECPSATYTTIQAAVTAANPGDTVQVCAGTYTEVGQIVIDKNLNIVGADKATTIIKPAQDTGDPSSGDARGWFLINGATTFNMSGVTLDGAGKSICHGIYDYALGTIQDINVKNIGCAQYYGRGIYLKNNATVRNVRFENIERIGVFIWQGATAAVVDGVTYIGKGLGDHLDYGIELGNGGVATLTNNTISGNRGVASVDGSTSAGILVTTYFGPGTTATITGNTLTDNTDGIAVGFDGSDASVVTAHNNNLSGNTEHGVNSTAPTVNASCNWWGAADGPGTVGPGSGSHVSTNVTFQPWLTTSDLVSGPCNGPITLTTLTVVKVLVNDNGGSAATSTFTFQVNAGGSQPFDSDGQNDLSLTAGSYSVVEDAASGYTTTYSNSANGSANCNNLTLPATCTITNDDIAAVPLPPPANACDTPTVAPSGYTLQNGTGSSNTVTIAPLTMFVGHGGNDTVKGPDAGNYIVCTGSGSDTITLGNGNFTIAADGGNNVITTGNGNGYISSGSSSDKITTGDGVQTIDADGGNNTIVTGNGNKTITTGGGSDKITTGSGNDTINADGGVNTVKSGAGNDTVTTGSGSDTVDGGPDTDTCNADSGFNTVTNCEL